MRVCNVISLEVHEWFNGFLSLIRLQRVIAYVLRFIRCTKRLNNPSESLYIIIYRGRKHINS